MGKATSIEWTHHTFNPWIGCEKATYQEDGKVHLHPGCAHCYAEALNRFHKWNGGSWGKLAPRKVKADSGWREPFRWARAAAEAGEYRRVFCGSLMDVLDEKAPPAALERLWDTIWGTVQWCTGCRSPVLEAAHNYGCPGGKLGGLIYLLLTKHPERWRVIPGHIRPWVWLGTSISDPRTAAIWGRRLQRAEGFRVRFYSAEPLLARIPRLPLEGIDWVIVGGESGPGARPCHVSHVEDIIAQCRRRNVPVFVKQLGAAPHMGDYELDAPWTIRHPKGGNPAEWPGSLRVREVPEVRP